MTTSRSSSASGKIGNAAAATRLPARWIVAIAALFAVGALQRTWNLLRYPIDMGFDAIGNWEYIAMLLADWHLPAPGDGWSTAHPPFFYAIGAAIGELMGTSDRQPVAVATIAVCNVVAIASIAAVAGYVRRSEGGDGARVLIASGLLLFLPVYVYMSPMLGEEILVTALITFAMVGLARELGRPDAERSDVGRPAWLGVLAGLAFLTKLTAAMPIAAGALVLLGEGPRRGWKRALLSTAAFSATAAVVGGWFYAHNLLVYGYLYPYALPVHSLMFDMPPGSRTLVDYVSFPLAALRASQASDPALLHSVWGSFWVSTWFDSHRCCVPLHPTRGLEAAASVLLVLGFVPTAAFMVGLVRGVRRAVLGGSGPDRLLVGMTALLVAGFVAFTWRNPWFPSVKGSYLLGLCLPYAVYTSETLREWMRGARWRAWTLGTLLAILCVTSTVTFTYNAVFVKREFPGTEWKAPKP